MTLDTRSLDSSSILKRLRAEGSICRSTFPAWRFIFDSFPKLGLPLKGYIGIYRGSIGIYRV